MLRESDTTTIREACESTLRRNWREGAAPADGVPFAYTCPSPGHYPWQWYWDSCFTAIAWRHFDPDRSRRELESLLAAAARGRLHRPHDLLEHAAARAARRYTYNVTSPDAPMTASIQPPALAWAWWIAVGDPAPSPAIARHHDWLARNRDLDGDGLIWIVQPDESGLDASPQFDAIWGWRSHAPSRLLAARTAQPPAWLRPAADRRRPAVRSAAKWRRTSSIRCRCMALGQPSLTGAIDRAHVRRAHRAVRAAGAPRPPPDRRPSPGRRPSSPGPRCRRWRCRICRRRSAGAWSRSTCSTSGASGCRCRPHRSPPTEPSFSIREDGFLLAQRRYWRGPTWINAAWLVWLGLQTSRVSGARGHTRGADQRRRPRQRAARVLPPLHRPWHGRGRFRAGPAW